MLTRCCCLPTGQVIDLGVSDLPEDKRLQACDDLWRKLDRNGNGYLSLGELTTGLRREYPAFDQLYHR